MKIIKPILKLASDLDDFGKIAYDQNGNIIGKITYVDEHIDLYLIDDDRPYGKYLFPYWHYPESYNLIHMHHEEIPYFMAIFGKLQLHIHTVKEDIGQMI
jgi:hypothetical protein